MTYLLTYVAVWTLARRLIAFLCIAAIVFAAFAPPGAATLPAILPPLWLCLFVVVGLLIRDEADEFQRPSRPFLLVLASRPPPFA